MDTRSFGQKINSRKLALTVGVILAATALLLGGSLSGENWVEVVKITAGAYMLSQAWLDKSK